RSLAKLAPIWIKRAAVKAARKTPRRKRPSPAAAALATTTGEMAAGKVMGRAAIHQIRQAGGRPASGGAGGAPGAGPPASREAGELGEVGLPLLKEGIATLLRLVGQVEEQGGVARRAEERRVGEVGG